MDATTLVIILLVVSLLLLAGGSWYSRGRWYLPGPFSLTSRDRFFTELGMRFLRFPFGGQDGCQNRTLAEACSIPVPVCSPGSNQSEDASTYSAARCSTGLSFRVRLNVAFTRATWENAWGKLPTKRPSLLLYSSLNNPTSFESAASLS